MKKMDIDTLVPQTQLKPGMVIVARHMASAINEFDSYSYPMTFIDDPGHGALNVDAFQQKRHTQIGYAVRKPPDQFWVRGMFEERKLTKDLRVGDVIVMCSTTPWDFNTVHTAPVVDPAYANRKDEDERYYDFQYRSAEGKVVPDGGRRGSLTWKVIVPLGLVSKRSNPLPGAKHIPEFPHKCTRCQQPAYVGLFEVVHQSKNTNCPARGA